MKAQAAQMTYKQHLEKAAEIAQSALDTERELAEEAEFGIYSRLGVIAGPLLSAALLGERYNVYVLLPQLEREAQELNLGWLEKEARALRQSIVAAWMKKEAN